MIEPGGHAQAGQKSVAIFPTKIRFNVNDVQIECQALRHKGVQVEVIDHSWGTTAKFSDPGGNRCAPRSQRDFGCLALTKPSWALHWPRLYQWAGDQWMAKRFSAFLTGISQIAREQ